MKITIEGREYTLDTKRAVKLGVLREQRTFNVALNENEVAVLQFILANVGGSPEGCRGYADSAGKKLREFSATCDKALVLDKSIVSPSTIYFE